MPNHQLHLSDPNTDIITGTCPHDCPDTCSWQVAVDRTTGRALDLWGHPDHPVTQGRLCTKVDNYLERTYHPDRLTTPLKRVGPKGATGSGHFAPVTWDEAIADIAARLQSVISQHGAEAVLPYSYAGTMGILQGDGLAAAFFNQMGASQLARTICSEAGVEGYRYTIGATEGTETESFAQAKLILIWGSNTLTSNLHLWPFVQDARKHGAKVIVIDPARTRTARAADEWLPINPGTDAALALAMMHVIIEEELLDAAYVADFTVGYAQLADQVAAWTPSRAAALTGIDAQRIRTLAREYATTRPAAIRINYGMQRHAGGGMAMRTIACLPALVGAWRDVGGGIQLSNSGSFRHMDRTSITRPDLLAGRTPRTLNMIALGDALSLDPARRAQAHYHPRPVDPLPAPDQAGPPVKALIVYNSNPAAIAPDQAAVRAGLMRDDLFTVVLEHFQTDTADYADYILPATTQLEHWDILKPYGHLYLGLNQPAIAPVGQSLPNAEIFRRLAAALGYTDPIFRTDDETLLRTFVESQTHPRFATVTWDTLLAQGFARLDLPTPYAPFAHGNFPTPSGKCEFYSARMAADGYDPVPNGEWQMANGAAMDPDSPFAIRHSFICISPPAHSFLNSSFVNVPRFAKREGEPIVWIHPADGEALSVTDGETVRLWNDLGEVTLTARLTADIVPGTVLAPGVWWAKLSPDGRNINQLTPQAQADMGGGATFYDARVWVEPVK
ncbi:MAG: molybdopterin oxidoreductase family protein [Caldilineaceae bacterium]|nr:molybdopterin oxidoreductase family protein [Caldilineaceae bacterium]MBP8110327.1 molybdopterin oxidoreductase family protein [Caldilineaceae bacterium]MBP9074736.1 molybdopterin oxidoreductase family protein [Caldilineaceae bacterium]